LRDARKHHSMFKLKMIMLFNFTSIVDLE